MTGPSRGAAQPAALCQQHAWSLRDVEYDEGLSLHRFECLDCGAVRYT